MTFEAAKDILLGGWGLTLAVLFVVDHGYGVYPMMALGFTGIWEILGWNGWSSVGVVALVVLSHAVAVGIRRRRGLALWAAPSLEGPEFRSLMFRAVGTFAVWLVITIMLSLA